MARLAFIINADSGILTAQSIVVTTASPARLPAASSPQVHEHFLKRFDRALIFFIVYDTAPVPQISLSFEYVWQCYWYNSTLETIPVKNEKKI